MLREIALRSDRFKLSHAHGEALSQAPLAKALVMLAQLTREIAKLAPGDRAVAEDDIKSWLWRRESGAEAVELAVDAHLPLANADAFMAVLVMPGFSHAGTEREARLLERLGAMEKMGLSMHWRDGEGDTLAHLFARPFHLSLVRFVEERGLSMLSPNHKGESPFQLAFQLAEVRMRAQLQAREALSQHENATEGMPGFMPKDRLRAIRGVLSEEETQRSNSQIQWLAHCVADWDAPLPDAPLDRAPDSAFSTLRQRLLAAKEQSMLGGIVREASGVDDGALLIDAKKARRI